MPNAILKGVLDSNRNLHG